MEGDKATGPDDFSLAFYKFCWDVVGQDLMKVFHEFHSNGVVGRRMNATFITLIPKKDRSINLKDFRPISLISSAYKILAKVLANRLSNLLDKTVDHAQSAFVGGRQILNVALVANEVIDETRRKGGKGLILKLDFESLRQRELGLP
jgi:hypothetical protein